MTTRQYSDTKPRRQLSQQLFVNGNKTIYSTDGHKTVVNKENGTAVTVDGQKTIEKKAKIAALF